MKFKVDLDKNILKGTLIYSSDESSVDFKLKDKALQESLAKEGETSLLINFIQLETSINGRVLFVYGLLTDWKRWKKATLSPPAAQSGAIFADLGNELIPGISKQITENDDLWPVYIDTSTDILRVGEVTEIIDSTSIEFAENCIATIRNGEIEALWLKIQGLSQTFRKLKHMQ